MQRLVTLSVVMAALVTVQASASVTSYTTPYGNPQLTSPTDTATFSTIVTGDDLSKYSEAGLSITVNDTEFGNARFYPNGGAREPIVINQLNGSDFDAIEVYNTSGYGGSFYPMWVQAYLNNVLVDEFDINLPSGYRWGLTGTFDEVWVGAFYDNATRNEHDWSNLNTAMLYNVAYATAQTVPVPGAMLLGLIGVALVRRMKRRFA